MVWFGLIWSGIWPWFQKIAILKKAFNIFLIFLAKKYCPKPSHRWLKEFAGDELRLGTTDNFVKKSVPASTSQIRPNQTKLAHEVYYILLSTIWEPTTKNFRALGPMGAMIMGPESSKLENCQFFWKCAPMAPQKGQKMISMVFWGFGTLCVQADWTTLKLFFLNTRVNRSSFFQFI